MSHGTTRASQGRPIATTQPWLMAQDLTARGGHMVPLWLDPQRLLVHITSPNQKSQDIIFTDFVCEAEPPPPVIDPLHELYRDAKIC